MSATCLRSSKEVRDAAKECEPKVEQLTTGLYLDAKLASVLKAYAERVNNRPAALRARAKDAELAKAFE